MERIYQKIGRIREYLSLIEEIKDECTKRFATDPMVIRHKKLRMPQSYQEAFDILGENRVLEPGFSLSFAKIAGFRNFLAHDYEKIDTAFICEDVLSKTGDVGRFLSEIEASLRKDSQ